MVDLLTPNADSVLGIDDAEADAVLAALSPDSAREILAALDDGPATAPELAERTDLTTQNVSYHLEKLVAADLVRTEGTRGTGGNAATVYAPARRIVLSTETGATHHRLRAGVAGLAAGALLGLFCLHSVLEVNVDPFAALHALSPLLVLV